MNTKEDIEFLKTVFQRLEDEFDMQTFEDEIDKDTEVVYMPFPPVGAKLSGMQCV